MGGGLHFTHPHSSLTFQFFSFLASIFPRIVSHAPSLPLVFFVLTEEFM